MPAYLCIENIPLNDYNKVEKTVKNYFETADNKPECFKYWVQDVVYDKDNCKILAMEDTYANPTEYDDFLTKLIENLAENHNNISFNGFFDLSHGYSTSITYFFSLTCGELEWKSQSNGEKGSAEKRLINFAKENGYIGDNDDEAIEFVEELVASGDPEAMELLESIYS